MQLHDGIRYSNTVSVCAQPSTFIFAAQIDKKGRLVKQEVHRPSTDSGPGKGWGRVKRGWE
jgi:hypothetical protein